MQRPKPRNNAVFDIRYHLVLVTKYRRQALSSEMREYADDPGRDPGEMALRASRVGGESDHIHLLFLAHPALDLCRGMRGHKLVHAVEFLDTTGCMILRSPANYSRIAHRSVPGRPQRGWSSTAMDCRSRASINSSKKLFYVIVLCSLYPFGFSAPSRTFSYASCRDSQQRPSMSLSFPIRAGIWRTSARLPRPHPA